MVTIFFLELAISRVFSGNVSRSVPVQCLGNVLLEMGNVWMLIINSHCIIKKIKICRLFSGSLSHSHVYCLVLAVLLFYVYLF